MSSKAKRASILKKQQHVSHNLDASATATSSSTCKGNKKIEFNRKKSIKEFLVGEDTDTIWGNSYEVSTDGTPSGGLGDATLGNSICRSSVDEQNKENRVQPNPPTTQKEEELGPSPNSTNGSWDLSVTLADDERRRIRSETSVLFSQSFNTTDRLLAEPLALSQTKSIPKQTRLAEQCDVQAMDISPLKGTFAVSPNKLLRKMKYYNPKEELYVEINDVPQAAASVAKSTVVATNCPSRVEGSVCASAPRILFQTPTRSTLRSFAAEASSRSTLRGTSFDVSETWNSHPHAMMNQMKLQQSNLEDLVNMSSDVDTTLAITNTVAKLLESGPNLTTSAPSTMELDESTTTERVPTNALARARPSFLPSQRAVDESANTLTTGDCDGKSQFSTETPENANKSLQLSAPLENQRCHSHKGSISINNGSLVEDLNQPPVMEETMQKSTISLANGNKSSSSNAATSRHGLSLDFGISSLSLKLATNSPETPAANRPKILRPTLPLALFNATDGSKRGPTPKKDLTSGNVGKEPIRSENEATIIKTRQTIHVAEDMETSFQKDNSEPQYCDAPEGSNFGSKLIETTYFVHPQQGDLVHSFAQTRLPVAMEDSVKLKASYRPTVHESKTIVEEPTVSTSNGLVHCSRVTVAYPERMETSHNQAEPPEPGNRLSIYDPDPIENQSMAMEQTVKLWWDEQKQGSSLRGTIHEKISIGDTTAIDGKRKESKQPIEVQQQQQHVRRTYYPDESLKMDTVTGQSAVATRGTPVRKTFYPDESFTVDKVAVVQGVSASSSEHPARKTIVCNETMVLDVCTDTDEAIETETSISCRLHGKNIDELSIHAFGPRNVIDMKISRPTTFEMEQCEESILADEPLDHRVREAVVRIDQTNQPPPKEIALNCRRLTTHAVRDMDEDIDLGQDAGETSSKAPQVKAIDLQQTTPVEDEQYSDRRRFTTHYAEMMDEPNADNCMRTRLEPAAQTHGKESPMDLTKGRNINERTMVKDVARSIEKNHRFSINEQQEMDASKQEQTASTFVSGKFRSSIYQSEDIDATKIDDRRADCAVFDLGDEGKLSIAAPPAGRSSSSNCADMDVTKGAERSGRSRIHSEGQIKTRLTSYGNDKMDNVSCFNYTPPNAALRQEELLKVQERQSQLSIYCQSMAREETKVEDQLNRSDFAAQPADITSYNVFLANHEQSDRCPKQQRLTTYYMEGMNEAGLDSTRLSRERQQIASERAIKTRPSTYHVEAMDETNVHDGSLLRQEGYTPAEMQRTNFPQDSVRLTSPIECGQQDDGSLPHPSQSQRMHQSVHHPVEMESTLLASAHEPQTAKLTSETAARRSQLRSIVKHTPREDMEGFSLLADDEDVSQQRSKKADWSMQVEAMHPSRGTIFYSAAAADDLQTVADAERQFAPKYRPTICHAEAMVEDTVAITGYRSTNHGTKPYEVDQEEERDERQGHAGDSAKFPSSMAAQRKSCVCMEETMLPVAVRIERRKSAFEKTPMLCTAEHPPEFATHRPQPEDEKETESCGQATIDETCLQKEARTIRQGNGRQTMHHASRMDMTLGPRESIIRTVGKEPNVDQVPTDRRTIYDNSKPMEETPPHVGRSSRGEPIVRDSTVSVEKTGDTVQEMVKKSEKISSVRHNPRQTILLPLDMDIDGGEHVEPASLSPRADVQVEGERSSLVRELTEDRVLRSAPSMPTGALFNGRGMAGGLGNLFREPASIDGNPKSLGGQLSEDTLSGGNAFREVPPGRGCTSSRFRPPSSTVHDLTDISMCNTTAQPSDLPQLANITGVMSLREITEPLPPAPLLLAEPDSSVSVICSTKHGKPEADSETHAQHSIVFAPLPAVEKDAEIPSEDEFYDAYDGAVADQQVDPLSLTKSRHLTMKFVDVEQLEQTRNHVALVVPATTSKRGNAHLLSSPAVSRAPETVDDPLRVTTLPQQQQPGSAGGAPASEHQTPRGPMMKRPRTSTSPEYRNAAAGQCSSPRDFAQTHRITVEPVEEQIVVKQEPHPSVEFWEEHQEVNEEKEENEQEDEEARIKEEHPTMSRVGSQSIIHDPSVFVIDEDGDLLDDESNPPCVSYSEEILPDPKEKHEAERQETPDGTDASVGSTPGTWMQPLSVGKMKELSFYRDFVNLTIDTLDSWDEEKMGDVDGGTGGDGRTSRDHEPGVVCISLTDEDDTGSITPPKRTQATAGASMEPSSVYDFKVRHSPTEVLDSTIASEFMHELRQKHPPTTNACCGTDQANGCFCRKRRELERRREACDVVWAQYCAWFGALKQRLADITGSIGPRDAGEGQRHGTLDEQIEELNWRLVRTKLAEQSFFTGAEMSVPADNGCVRQPTSGQFPETPSVVFLYENLQRFLSEQTHVDTSPSPGAPLPATPSITFLIANKLSSDSGTRWHLDCSEESEGVLVLLHRTLRSVVISVRLQQDWEKDCSKRKERGREEERRLEWIQVRECHEEYVHSPKLLLAHIEFMRLAKETTERTLRSTYRTVASLLGLWQRFDELLRRVFDSVNRLVTITRNNDALLCYDAEMERFLVKKYFHRCLDDGKMEPNMLTVRFTCIGNLCASGVSFRRPMPDAQKLLPGAGKDRPVGTVSSTAEQTGLMFFECLLWNVTKQFES